MREKKKRKKQRTKKTKNRNRKKTEGREEKGEITRRSFCKTLFLSEKKFHFAILNLCKLEI